MKKKPVKAPIVAEAIVPVVNEESTTIIERAESVIKRHLISACHTFISAFVPTFFGSLAYFDIENWTISAVIGILWSSAITAMRAVQKMVAETYFPK